MASERIDSTKAISIIAQLHKMTRGPAEAYGILCLAIWLLNFEISDHKVSMDQLCDEVTESLRSIKKERLDA